MKIAVDGMLIGRNRSGVEVYARELARGLRSRGEGAAE